MSFETLGLAPELLEAVQAAGYSEPTPIQAQAIPHLLAGRDLMGCAQTGTGKTAAFTLPILHQIRGTEPGRLRALVLVPTRELAMQVGSNVRMFAEPLGLRSTAVYGGVPFGPQEMMLRHGVDVLVATPGRLKDFLWRGMIDFRETAFLVLDEADRMLDMGFIDDVREIVELIPRERQTMLFSATLEAQIVRLARDILRQPVRVEVAPPATVADGVRHSLVLVAPGSKRAALEEVVRDREADRTLVFTRTKRGAHQLALHLRRAGHKVSSIHSDKTQSQRVAALEAFRAGKIDILVATDIAARGLDVQGISHVVNYDVPLRAEDYVHRIGRTARAGRTGVAVSLVTPEDRRNISAIERLIGLRLEENGGERPAPRSRRRAASETRPGKPAAAELPAGARSVSPPPPGRGGRRGGEARRRPGARERPAEPERGAERTAVSVRRATRSGSTSDRRRSAVEAERGRRSRTSTTSPDRNRARVRKSRAAEPARPAARPPTRSRIHRFLSRLGLQSA